VTFTGKVLRWKLYLQDRNVDLYHVAEKEEHQFVPDALSRLYMNNSPPPPTVTNSMLMVLRPAVHFDHQTHRIIRSVHNKEVRHWGLHICKKLLRNNGHSDILNRETAYLKEENGIVESANQEVLRYLHALLFDSRVHDKWSS